MMEHSIDYGQTNIKFKINRRQRKTLGINVLPSGEVTVDAPEDASIDKIKEVIHKRGNWILRQRREVASYPPPLPPKLYLSGETFKYLGVPYRLRVVESDRNHVGTNDDRIVVYSSHGTSAKVIQKKLTRWFRKESERIFAERLEYCMALVEKIGIGSKPKIRIRRMEKRWGSCTIDGIILLNPELISVPVEYIDYVIVHELCHLKEHNHGDRFYHSLGIVLPSHKTLKKKLDTLSEEVLF